MVVCVCVSFSAIANVCSSVRLNNLSNWNLNENDFTGKRFSPLPFNRASFVILAGKYELCA